MPIALRSSKRRGSLLIESAVSAGIFTLAVLVIYLGFIQARRISARNSETSTAISLINSQIDLDSKTAYNDLTNTNPEIIPLTLLPNATLTRAVTTDAPNSIKQIHYRLQWEGANGSNAIEANYELTPTGLNND